MSLTVCAIFRNEAPYLPEWIEFHRIVGFERFYLYQNNSDDNWQAVLRPYIEAGIVEVIDWPMPPPAQVAAYQHFIDRHLGLEEWVAFLDCDEFLFSPKCDRVSEVLEQEPFRQRGAIAAHWMCLGASRQERRGDAPVIERFTWRPADRFATNEHVKSIVRVNRVESAGMDPHLFNVRGGTFTESGRLLSTGFSAPPTHLWLRINHYITKSREEWIAKVARGRADVGSKRDPCEFDRYQACDVDDRAIWRFLPELKRRLSRHVR